MEYVIETRIFLGEPDYSFQSRVIEVPSWDIYVNILEHNLYSESHFKGTLRGDSLPFNIPTAILHKTAYQIVYEFVNNLGQKTIQYCYRLNDISTFTGVTI